jgi:hypothetical protein
MRSSYHAPRSDCRGDGCALNDPHNNKRREHPIDRDIQPGDTLASGWRSHLARLCRRLAFCSTKGREASSSFLDRSSQNAARSFYPSARIATIHSARDNHRGDAAGVPYAALSLANGALVRIKQSSHIWTSGQLFRSDDHSQPHWHILNTARQARRPTPLRSLLHSQPPKGNTCWI